MSKFGQRFKNIGTNYKLASQHDSRLGLYLALTFVGILAVSIGIGAAISNIPTMIFFGIPVAVLATAFLFSRRAMRSAYKNIEGKPGAAVAVVGNMSKQGWTCTAMVNPPNKAGDLVHRAIGRPGIVLIGEGKSPALPNIMAAEKKRTQRFASEAPIHEIVIGDAPGQVQIAKLDRYMRKMDKVLSPGEATELRKRLDALAAAPLPIPKGPMPKSARAAATRGKSR